VEGSAPVRQALDKRLTSAGLKPSQAEDFPSALHLLYTALSEEKPFRAAVIDLQLPGVSGETLVHAIQAEPLLREMRVVLLDAPENLPGVRAFPDTDFAAYLAKPVRNQEIIDAISALFADKSVRPSQSTPSAFSGNILAHLFADTDACILLVEDNLTNQEVAKGILSNLGLRVDVACNGAQAIQALESFSYGLVLMDVQMPVMDGIEATRRIRSATSTVLNPRIPIIAMTAHALEGDRLKCIAAGMDDFVTKPVYPKVLTEALLRWLPSAKASAPQPKRALPPVFDRAGMRERLMNDDGLIQLVTGDFLKDMPVQIQALRQFAEQGDAYGAFNKAHLIKGAASNVGGEALRAVAFTIEKAGKSGDLSAVSLQLEELEDQFRRLKEAMTESI